MSSLRKLNGLQLGGDGDTGFPSLEGYKQLLREQGETIDNNTIGFKYNSVKKAYEIWNNHTDRNDFDLFWKEIHSKYRDSGLTLEKYTRQCIADKNHKECQPIEQAAKKQRIIARSDSVTTATANVNTNGQTRKVSGKKTVVQEKNLRQHSAPGALGSHIVNQEPINESTIKLVKQGKPSIFDKLILREKGISDGTTNANLLNFLNVKYSEFIKSFGQNNYPLFEKVLLRWNDYPVPIDFTTFLSYYIYCFSEWVSRMKNQNIEEFDKYYEIFYKKELIPTWEFVLEEYANEDIERQMKEFPQYITDFIKYTKEQKSKVKKNSKTNKKSQESQIEKPPQQQPSTIQGCASREPPQYNENAVKTYNKLINCLDIGKDATSTSQSLNATEHGNFILNNVINPLFGYNNIPESITDKYNFNGVGDKSIALYNDIIRLIDPTITNIPIYKHIVPEIFSYERYLQELRLNPNVPQLHEPGRFYVIQDAGYAPRFIFQDYKNLFTFATILDTASFSTENAIDLTKIPIYQIKQDILEKYSLNTCINGLSFQKDSRGNYRIHFDLNPNGTIDEYFNTSYNPMAADGTELFNRMSRAAAPIDTAQPPPFYTQGNYNKNYYIRENYTDQRRLLDIQKLVLIKEMGDTLKAMLLDQLLSYTEETLALYPDLAANQDRLPFCRENCIVTTNDSNLAMRCLLNKINSIVTSGRNVTKMNFGSNGLMDVAAPFYRIESDAEIRGKVETLKKTKIDNLFAQNNEVIGLLMEIVNTDAIYVYFEDKTINQIQKELLNVAISIAKTKNPNDPDIPRFEKDLANDDPDNIKRRRKFLCCVLNYIAYCLSFINQKIKEIFNAYSIATSKEEEDAYTVEDVYKSFLSEIAKFKFESPFEKYVDEYNNIKYLYSPNQKNNNFCFLPKLYGIKEMDNDYNTFITHIEQVSYGLYYYPIEKYKYEDFSLLYYFKIGDINKLYQTDFGSLGIGSIYRIINNRIENKNFTADQINEIVELNGQYYLVITPSLYSEINKDIIGHDNRNNIFYKCIKSFCIKDIIYDIGCSYRFVPGNLSWINNNNKYYSDNIKKLNDFSQLLDPFIFINSCIENQNNNISNDIVTNFNQIMPAGDLTCMYKTDSQEVFGPFRKNNIIEDTLVFEDIKKYPNIDIAKKSYINKEIAEFVNSLVESKIIEINTKFPKLTDEKLYYQENKDTREKSPTKYIVDKLHKITVNLIYDMKTDLQKIIIGFISNNILNEPAELHIKEDDIVSNENDNYKGRIDDTSLHIDGLIWENIPLSNVFFINRNGEQFIRIRKDNISTIFNKLITSYNEKLNSLFKTIINSIPNTMKGGNNDNISNNNTDPHNEINIKYPSFNSNLNETSLTVFEQTIFQKYFQNIGPTTQKPGLLTFHMLCYFPKIIFMVYSLLKYIEADPQLQTLYNVSYAPLKDILVKFYERDFSDELNRIFHDMVGESVEPTYEGEGTIGDLANYDNATALIIDIAQQMYNVAGLFKMGEEKFKADLALFNTNLLKKEPGPLFLKIAQKENKHDIEYLYGRLFDAEYYVCDTKGLYKKDDGTYGEEFNSIRVFEKFLANGVYSYGLDIVAEEVVESVADAEPVKTNIPQKVAPGAPKKEDVGFLAKMLGTLGLGKEEEEEPMPIRKLNFASTNVNENENPTAPVPATGGAKKTRKRSSSAKRYKKTRKNRKDRA